MSWSSGTYLLSALIRANLAHIPWEQTRYEMYLDYIRAFWDADCDCLYECKGKDPAFDRALEYLQPSD